MTLAEQRQRRLALALGLFAGLVAGLARVALALLREARFRARINRELQAKNREIEASG